MSKFLPVLLMLTTLASCQRYAYYQSALHTNTNPYKTLPLLSDSVKSTVYASGAFTGGGANDALSDGFTGGLFSVYRTHSFGRFHAFYGFSGSAGSYKVDSMSYYNSYDSSYYRSDLSMNVNDSILNSRAGRKSWGSIGSIAGMTYVVPYANGGEWRALGAEFSWTREFGGYQAFRRGLPDHSADLVDRNRNLATLTLSTEFVGRTQSGTISYKLAYGWNLRSIPGYYSNGEPGRFQSSYMSNVFAFTVRELSGFFQWNIGTHAMNAQLGMNINLGSFRKEHPTTMSGTRRLLW